MVADFYDKNKPLFEITGVLLVLSGLFLNLEISSGIGSVIVKQLTFMMLAASCATLLNILLDGHRFFRRSLVEKSDRNLAEVHGRMEYLQDGDWEELSSIRRGATRVWRSLIWLVIINILLIVFAGNLIAFLLLLFPAESAVLIISAMSWGFALAARTYEFEILLLRGLMLTRIQSSLLFVGLQTFLSIIFLILIPSLSYLYFIWDISWSPFDF